MWVEDVQPETRSSQMTTILQVAVMNSDAAQTVDYGALVRTTPTVFAAHRFANKPYGTCVHKSHRVCYNTTQEEALGDLSAQGT